MGDKYDEVMRRNRMRITGLALAGLLNYWIAVLLFVIAVVVGSIGTVIIWGIAEGGDFELLWVLLKWIPRAVVWVVAAGWLTSPVMGWLFIGFVAFGTLLAIAKMWGALRRLEQLVPRSAAEDPTVANVLEAVALAAGVSAPRLVVLQDRALNSCSVGRKPSDATIVVTTGLVESVSRDELEAVLAYELSRVTSLDTAVSTWTAAVTGRTIALAEETNRVVVELALAVPVRLARRLRARSLQRQAGQRDILALSFTRHPEALLSALEKIDADERGITTIGLPTGPLWLKWPWPLSRRTEGAPELGGRIQELKALVAAY